jgi:hypothetical protein
MFGWIKAHWMLAGGAVLGIIILFVLIRNAGGSGDVQAAAQMSDPNAVASGTAIAQAQIAGQIQASHDNANLAALQITADRDLQLADKQGAVAEYLASLNSHTQELVSTLNTNVALNQLNTQLQAKGLDADVEKARIYSDANKAAWGFQTIQAVANGRSNI